MNAVTVDGFFDIFTEPQVTYQCLLKKKIKFQAFTNWIWYLKFWVIFFYVFYIDDRGGDSCPAGCSDDRTDFARRWIHDNGGRHGWQGPFAWPYEIGRTWWHSEKIRRVRRWEIVHFVIHDDASLLRDESSSETCSKNFFFFNSRSSNTIRRHDGRRLVILLLLLGVNGCRDRNGQSVSVQNWNVWRSFTVGIVDDCTVECRVIRSERIVKFVKSFIGERLWRQNFTQLL